MTYEELILLEKKAHNTFDDAKIQLIEIYCTDYAKICADNTVYHIIFQTFKLLWVNLKKYLPSLANEEGVLQAARNFKTTPNKNNFKSVIGTIRQVSDSLGDSKLMLSRIVHTVWVTIGQKLPSMLEQSFGRYANTSIASKLICNFVDNPSYKKFADMIVRIESFGNSHTEAHLAKDLLLKMFVFFYEKDIYKFKEVENECSKIAQLTNTTDEYIFLHKFLLANEGDVQAMLETGDRFERGIGISQDEIQAEKWYSKALMEGHPNAQFFITNLYTKQHHRQIEEQNKILLTEQQRTIEKLKSEHHKALEKIKFELQTQREKTKRLEQEKCDTVTALNQKIKELQCQLSEANDARLTSIVEDNIEVIFYYKLRWKNGITQGNKIGNLSQATYNNLIMGGKQAIIAFVEGLRGYMKDGEYIIDAYMTKL